MCKKSLQKSCAAASQLVNHTSYKYHMQIKHYTIPDPQHLAVIQDWALNPDNHCIIIAQGRVGAVTHSLCVNQPPGVADMFARTESQLSGMIQPAPALE